MKTDELINMLAQLEPVKRDSCQYSDELRSPSGGIGFCLMLQFSVCRRRARRRLLPSQASGAGVHAGIGLRRGELSDRIRPPGEPGRKPLILISVLFFALISPEVSPSS